MDILMKIFPFSFKAKEGVAALIIMLAVGLRAQGDREHQVKVVVAYSGRVGIIVLVSFHIVRWMVDRISGVLPPFNRLLHRLRYRWLC